MSLTVTDLEQIGRLIDERVWPIVHTEVREELRGSEEMLETIQSDVSAIDLTLTKMQLGLMTNRPFQRLSLEQQMLQLNAEFATIARQLHIKLPPQLEYER